MNPLTQTRNIMKLNDREIELGVAGTKNSWHQEYKDSAWVFLGGMPYELTEGDIICMFSQYGEVVHINLIRDHTSGKSKGFGFLCYEDQRSTILAVDNLNGFKILGRMIRVDHIHQYKLPKDLEKLDQDKKALFMSGVAPKPLSEPESSSGEEEELLEMDEEETTSKSKKKKKKEKKKHKKKKKKKDKGGGGSSTDSEGGGDDRKHRKHEKPRNGDEPPRARERSRSPRREGNGDRHRRDRSGERSRDERKRSPDQRLQRRSSREKSRSPRGGERRPYDRKRSRSRDRRRDR
eukprot:TRINITY_DN6697_c0_g1_i12.p1 TRINITY_DN6697_c0_g1~~TRINITY_DN6697_c0_g1_i12.p1  ORF type:complete len:292 (-),score=74.05 TRINITY_DN6697_c0_g1_i12:177-1052(-)